MFRNPVARTLSSVAVGCRFEARQEYSCYVEIVFSSIDHPYWYSNIRIKLEK